MVGGFSRAIAEAARKSEVAATGAPVLLHVALRGVPIPRDQIQHHHAACGQLALLATRRGPNFFILLARGRIAMPVQKLCIGQLGIRPAGLRRVLQVVARFGGVALAFHLPGAGREIVGRANHTNTNA